MLKVNLSTDLSTATALAELRTKQYKSVVITDICMKKAYLVNLFVKRCNKAQVRITFKSIHLIDQIKTYDNLFGKIDVMPCILRNSSA